MVARKLLTTLALIAACSGPALAANFVQNGGPSSITIVNLTTGAITLCSTDGNFATGAQLPVCIKIGTLNVTGVAGNPANVAINPVPASLQGEVITNLTNGDYVQCNIQVVNGTPDVACQTGTAF